MPFRNLVSWTGANGPQSAEPDADSGLWRAVAPPKTLLNIAAYTITSENVMNGIIINATSCVYTMPTAAHLLADYPDWPINGVVTFAIFGSGIAATKSFIASAGTTLALGNAAGIAGACFVAIWRDSDTTFKYTLLRTTY